MRSFVGTTQVIAVINLDPGIEICLERKENEEDGLVVEFVRAGLFSAIRGALLER